MDDNDRRNALISAISHGESRLARLDKERHKILAELKSLKAEFLKFSNSSLDITKDTTASDGILSKISRPLLPLDLSILSVGLDERLGNAPRLSKEIAREEGGHFPYLGWFNRPRLNRNVWHVHRTVRLKASKQFKLYGSICKIEPAHLIIDNKGLINEGNPITALSHISIEMQTIIGIISLYAQNSNDMCH